MWVLPACLQEERERGYFDDAGNYVERPDKDAEEEAADAWLQSGEGWAHCRACITRRPAGMPRLSNEQASVLLVAQGCWPLGSRADRCRSLMDRCQGAKTESASRTLRHAIVPSVGA